MIEPILEFVGILEQRPTETDMLIGKTETQCYRIRTILQLDQVSHWYENVMFDRLYPGFAKMGVTSVEMKNGSYVVIEYDDTAFTVVMKAFRNPDAYEIQKPPIQ